MLQEIVVTVFKTFQQKISSTVPGKSFSVAGFNAPKYLVSMFQMGAVAFPCFQHWQNSKAFKFWMVVECDSQQKWKNMFLILPAL